jgi:DHA1 family tetracycline resistance protein-like MFS transporter
MRTPRRASLAFIFITLLIDVIGFGIVIPVLPGLVTGLAGNASAGVHYYGWLLSLYGIMQFLCAPVLGSLSDRYGRRPVLLLSLLFTGVDYVVQALAPTVAWLFVGRIIAGMTGASFTAASAYIADISPPEKRAQNFGMMGTAFGLGFIIGPAIGGLLGNFGPRVPFWGAAVMCVLNFAYGLVVLPESLDLEHRRPFTMAQFNPLKSLAVLARTRVVLLVSLMAGLLWLAQQVPPSVWVLYTQFKFHWDARANGLSMALFGACSMFIQMYLIRRLSARLGEVGTIWFALFFNFVGFILLGTATNSAWMVMAMVLWTLCFVGGPTISSVVSQQFGPSEQGVSLGALTAIQSLTGIIGPPIFTGIFGLFTLTSGFKIPGSPFFLGAAFTIVAAMIAASALPQITRREA